jgi:hypothetical protein
MLIWNLNRISIKLIFGFEQTYWHDCNLRRVPRLLKN